MAFISCTNGDLTKVFVTEADIIDQYVGNQLWVWGIGTAGKLGSNSTTARSSPIQTVSTGFNWSQISVGGPQIAGIKTDGTLWLWGEAGTGELGNNAATDRSSPVQTISTGTNWKQVSTAGSLTVGLSAAIKTDGTLWLWGEGANGKLGNNNTINVSSPVQTVSTATNWKQVSIGPNTSAAIKSDGTLWLWGTNGGRLGNNSTIAQSSPVQTISTGTNWKQVSAGAINVAAIKTDGTLWLWGSNGTATLGYGTLGNNSTIDQSSPVQTIAQGTNWKQVSVGLKATGAIKIDGTLWLWGGGGIGVLGNNSIQDRSSPVQTISTGTNWKQVSVGESVGAIKNDGTLWVWGCNGSGRLGNNSTINQSSPVQTVVTGTNWKQVCSAIDQSNISPTNNMGAVTHTEN